MNDSPGQTASCLAITEKKTHRPGGCVGIFFQLFDWKRRFANKKLFSKKLLPPSRAKQVSKKFRDEKMSASKHLIADENSGGFPNAKKNVNRSIYFEHKHELRPPSLVARLMGLESMPATREKPKKASFTHACDSGENTFVNNHTGCDRDELNLEKGNAKPESRPQKLQKMGPNEKRAVTRFGAEALHIKSVLSQSKKHHHHPKLASPVKSPSMPSGKNASRTSRLIDAATRILEPGLQSTNRAKCALTYSSSFRYPPVDEDDGTEVKSPDISKHTCHNPGAANSLVGSCKSCGNLVDVVDLRSKVEEQQPAFPSFASNIVNGSLPVAEQSKPNSSISTFGQEKDAVSQGTRNQPLSVSGQKGIQSLGGPVSERNYLPSGGQASWQLSSSQPCKPQNEESSSITLKYRSQMKHRVPLGTERIPPRSKINNLDSRRASSAANAVRGTKDFVALNRNLSGRTQPRVPTKVNDSKFDTEGKAFTRKDDYPSQLGTSIRKRRMINANGQVESRGFVSSTATREGNAQFNASTGKGLGNGVYLMNHKSAKSKLAVQREGNRANKDTDVISFTFNSPIRNNAGIPTEMVDRSMENGIKASFQNPLPLSGDSIGAFLEQKLRELACQEEDDLATGASSSRSSAIILQELISALTAERPLSHDGHMANTDVTSPAQEKTDRSVGIFHDGHRLSPGCVLEASFSSSSLDDSSGRRSFYSHSVDYSNDQLPPLGHDADLIDSATSVDRKKTRNEMVTALANNISRILHGIDAGGGRLRGGKLTHASEVILNAELLFGDVTLHNMDVTEGLFVVPLLLDLENIARSIMKNCSAFSGSGDTREGTKRSEFLFDCVLDYLDTRYGRCCNSGFRFWEKLPLSMNRKLMIQEVEEDIEKWTHLAGMIPDELIEWEMSHSLGKWTDFDVEAFEAGSEIDGDILQNLVNEVVIDLCECRLGYF